MQDHAPVLQQRIQVITVRRRRDEPRKGVRGGEQEGEEAHRDQAHDAEHTRHHVFRQVAREYRHRRAPETEDQYPQQHRTLVRAPGRGDAIYLRQTRVGVARHVQHGKIVGKEGPRQTAERQRDEDELCLRGRTRHRHQGAVATLRADQRQHRLHQRQQQPKNQCEMSKFGNHVFSSSAADVAPAALIRPPFAGLSAPVRRRAPPRGACSSRRAWRAPAWR